MHLPSVSQLCILALALAASACPRRSKVTDEDRLKRKLDTTKVHIYVGLKATLADADAAEGRELRATLLLLLGQARGAAAAISRQSSSAPTRVVASPPTRAAASAPASRAAARHTLRQLATVAKKVWRLKKRGAALVRAGKDPPPMLPVLIPKGEVLGIDAQGEHALLSLVFVIAKVHPKVPVPLPPEILLYEASRTRPDALKTAEAKVGMRALRAWVFAQNELCELASREERIFTKNVSTADLARLEELLPKRLRVMPQGQGKYLSAALSALAAGATAICYLSRDEEAKALKKATQMLDAAEKLGVKTPESELLRAFVACRGSKRTAVSGLARAAALSTRKGIKAETRATAVAVVEYCRTAAGTQSNLLRKATLVRVSISLAWVLAERAGATRALEQTEVYAAGRRMGQLLARVSGGASGPAAGEKGKGGVSGKLKTGAKGLLRKLRGAKKKAD